MDFREHNEKIEKEDIKKRKQHISMTVKVYQMVTNGDTDYLLLIM